MKVLGFLSLALVAAALLDGCATPLYQTSYRYEPPTDAQGLACIERRASIRTDCQAACQTAFLACQKNIEPQVAVRYDEALKRYEDELDRYLVELRHYELQLWMNWTGPWYYGPGYYDPWRYYGWPGPYAFPPPVPPRKPSRDAVRAALEKQQCKADCGCQGAYDDGFVACGGKRVIETRCIAHCPRQP